jgi:hypothetical protein
MDKLMNTLQAKSKRVAVTIPILKLIKKNLSKSDFDRKNLIWTTSTLAFTGGFRVHELLARERKSSDPLVTLLGRDGVLDDKNKHSHVQILLKTHTHTHTHKKGGQNWEK